MKNKFKILCILTLLPLLILFSCKKDKSDNNNIDDNSSCLVGSWLCTLHNSGFTVTLTYIFKSDKTYSFSDDSTHQTQSGTWSLTGNTVILNGNSSFTLILDCPNNNLTFQTENFKKQ
jgi:hypothetical protein